MTIMLVLAIAALLLLIPLTIMRGRHAASVREIVIPMQQGTAREKVAAAGKLAQKPLRVVRAVADAYLAAMASADEETRIQLIRYLADVEKGLRAQADSPGIPRLPIEYIRALKDAARGPEPGISSAAKETLANIGSSGD